MVALPVRGSGSASLLRPVYRETQKDRGAVRKAGSPPGVRAV